MKGGRVLVLATVGLALTACGAGANGPASLVALPYDIGVAVARANAKPKPEGHELFAETTTDFTCPTAMKSASRDAAIPSSAELAVVVFVRPARDPDDDVLIVDDWGGVLRFLGQSQAGSHFASVLPAGEHVFLGWFKDAAALRATLVAGRRYTVEVALDGGLTGPKTRLAAVAPGRKSWSSLAGWIEKTSSLVPDEKRGQACLRTESEKLALWTARARAALTKYDASQLAERTLLATDGQ